MSQKSETVAVLPLSRRFLRQSHFSATVWTGLNRTLQPLGDKLHFYIVYTCTAIILR